MQCPQIFNEKIFFASLTNNFWSFKKRIKKYSSMEQNLFVFFIINLKALHSLFAGTYIRIWGYLYSAGIALQLYSALRFERLKRVQKPRTIPWDFWDEGFSLSMPSVCPHLTTVHMGHQAKQKYERIPLALNITQNKSSVFCRKKFCHLGRTTGYRFGRPERSVGHY